MIIRFYVAVRVTWRPFWSFVFGRSSEFTMHVSRTHYYVNTRKDPNAAYDIRMGPMK